MPMRTASLLDAPAPGTSEALLGLADADRAADVGRRGTEAAAALTRIATPWLLGSVEWTSSLVVRAVTWLSHQTGKAILKLTQRDYAEHRLSALVARYGSPGALNGEVFNALGAKIRGRSKLPRGKRVICFSPHPDDDVISMGGILHKLAANANEITVAYMTSGNLAVFDHDVRRHLDFIHRLAAERHLPDAAAADLERDVDDVVTESAAVREAREVAVSPVLGSARVVGGGSVDAAEAARGAAGTPAGACSVAGSNVSTSRRRMIAYSSSLMVPRDLRSSSRLSRSSKVGAVAHPPSARRSSAATATQAAGISVVRSPPRRSRPRSSRRSCQIGAGGSNEPAVSPLPPRMSWSRATSCWRS